MAKAETEENTFEEFLQGDAGSVYQTNAVPGIMPIEHVEPDEPPIRRKHE